MRNIMILSMLELLTANFISCEPILMTQWSKWTNLEIGVGTLTLKKVFEEYLQIGSILIL